MSNRDFWRISMVDIRRKLILMQVWWIDARECFRRWMGWVRVTDRWTSSLLEPDRVMVRAGYGGGESQRNRTSGRQLTNGRTWATGTGESWADVRPEERRGRGGAGRGFSGRTGRGRGWSSWGPHTHSTSTALLSPVTCPWVRGLTREPNPKARNGSLPHPQAGWQGCGCTLGLGGMTVGPQRSCRSTVI